MDTSGLVGLVIGCNFAAVMITWIGAKHTQPSPRRSIVLSSIGFMLVTAITTTIVAQIVLCKIHPEWFMVSDESGWIPGFNAFTCLGLFVYLFAGIVRSRQPSETIEQQLVDENVR